MSLRGFHVIFIAISALLLFGIAAFQFMAWQQVRSTGELAVGVSSLIAGAALAAYGTWYFVKTRRATT